MDATSARRLRDANPNPILALFGLQMASAVTSGWAAEDPTWDSQPSELGQDFLFSRINQAGDACIAGRYQIDATKGVCNKKQTKPCKTWSPQRFAKTLQFCKSLWGPRFAGVLLDFGT